MWERKDKKGAHYIWIELQKHPAMGESNRLLHLKKCIAFHNHPNKFDTNKTSASKTISKESCAPISPHKAHIPYQILFPKTHKHVPLVQKTTGSFSGSF
mmetsp:Transcript_55697/g.82900  ORF Transcript_55697/g.82900 Transcript_55697/m.82900 type:complete len:99 (-) Transcript_55697:366-662(-)